MRSIQKTSQRTSIVADGSQEPVESQAQPVLSILIGDCDLNKANVQPCQPFVNHFKVQEVFKVALACKSHYWEPRFPECRYVTVSANLRC